MKEKFETATFGVGEKEKIAGSVYGETKEVCYCVYCGNKAETEDIGETSNHRWEEHVIHYCSCAKAMEEKEMKKELAEINNRKFHLENKLKRMQEEGENNLHVRKKKAKFEMELIKKKYNLNEQEV